MPRTGTVSPRPRLGRVRMAAATVVLALVAGCGSSAHGTSPTTSFVPATIATTVPLDRGAAAAVGRRMITDLPAGFTLQADSVAGTGPADLGKAASDAGGTATARAFLVRNHFLGGYQRLWADTKQDDILVSIYRFATAAGARAQDAVVPHDDNGQTSHPFVIPGIPGARGYVSPDASSPAVVAQFTRGGYAVEVSVVEPDATAAKVTVTELAQAQYARLG